ncbi:MAG: hypothetical protein ACYDA8_05855 [Deferrisomatales bacterium]
MKALWGLVVGVAAGVASGCLGLPAEVQTAPGFASSGPYAEALARHTRRAELYQGFDTVAKAWATWRSPELRRDLAEASVRAYGLTGSAADDLRREEARVARLSREFHLALYTPKADWNDLESPDSLWRVYVELPGGRRVAPTQVIHLPKSDRAAVAHPYVTPWTREYSLLFPVLDPAAAEAPPELVVTGPLGAMRFQF